MNTRPANTGSAVGPHLQAFREPQGSDAIVSDHDDAARFVTESRVCAGTPGSAGSFDELPASLRGLSAFAYGLVVYAASFAALLYLVGFSGGFLVPTSVDHGPAAPLPIALVADVLLLGLFGLQHSVMARPSFKRWWTRVVPQPVERSTYVLATSLVLALLFWQWRPVGVPIAWHVESPVGAGALWVVFGLGWVLVLLSTFQIDHLELFGLKQVMARLRGQALRHPRFQTPLLYRYVRHPLYLGVLLSLWSVPRMTAGHLLFSAGLTVYVLIGIRFEERDLVVQFGERYRRYRTQVGMLVPRRSRPND